MSREVVVYAHWKGIQQPLKVGLLRADKVRSGEHFSFSYDTAWLTSPYAQQIDPDLHLYSGEQHSQNDRNFRSFLDSCPDRWGRLIMQRREAVRAQQEKRKPKKLTETDYLLGVHDMHRMGALRFKLNENGSFLDDNSELSAPPMASLRELEQAVSEVEKPGINTTPEYTKWLNMLISPGSSLGGARPKASVIDESGELWIAKFPSRYDDYDIAAWEMLVYKLAIKAGVDMAECDIKLLNSHQHTFLTKRFDRQPGERLHFSSAMTQLAYFDGEEGASYLELAEFLIENGANTKADLAQLWRRIVFYIAVSNTDDHLRNHGFIHTAKGWILSPAYDINPVPDGSGLHLNIDEIDNQLDFELAFSVIDYFQLNRESAEAIYQEVVQAVEQWRDIAKELKISRQEQEMMAPAFMVKRLSTSN
ncbi:type II toxin-antitoxin system HipA family toxin [Alkalimonas collagenimarina]|uniref:Type II toxin-antitoxin system HipA family toxin n=1 Tax=Alkalimonas collagenimarina TaxID=400390 RepID=A0ABT9GXT3_9GAMM|nr:type II toxin-antitoxin system HipA family toxin [Alkalimonas collagenimarina]MDP4535856.1 type II toxin-antitoxin system HipA family toxin [Alkalimonas collagenimarina]